MIASEARSFWFSIEEIAVGEDGAVRFTAVDQEGIIWLEATGNGAASGSLGNIVMTLRVGQARSDVIWGGAILLGSSITLVKGDGKLFEALAVAAGKAAQLLKGEAKGTVDPEGVKAATEPRQRPLVVAAAAIVAAQSTSQGATLEKLAGTWEGHHQAEARADRVTFIFKVTDRGFGGKCLLNGQEVNEITGGKIEDGKIIFDMGGLHFTGVMDAAGMKLTANLDGRDLWTIAVTKNPEKAAVDEGCNRP